MAVRGKMGVQELLGSCAMRFCKGAVKRNTAESFKRDVLRYFFNSETAFFEKGLWVRFRLQSGDIGRLYFHNELHMRF